MVVKDEGGWKCWCYLRKGGEGDFFEYIQDNNVIREYGYCFVSVRYFVFG